jgi:hypothetical protein
MCGADLPDFLEQENQEKEDDTAKHRPKPLPAKKDLPSKP